MGTIDQNNYNLILAEMIRLIWKYGALFVKANVLEEKKEIELEVGTLESIRLQGYGPAYVKLGDKDNSHIVYRVDYIAAYKLGIDYYPTVEESRKILEDAIKTKYIKKYYGRAEMAFMYGFRYQTARRHYTKFLELKKLEDKGIDMEYPDLINPKLSKPQVKTKSRYNYKLDDILDHICNLTYIKTMKG